MKNLFALDLGNGNIKVISTLVQEALSFPAILGQLSSTGKSDVTMNNDRLSNMFISVEGRDIAVGRMAIKNSRICSYDISDDRYLSSESALLSSTALSLVSEGHYVLGNIVLGLPIHMMHIADRVKQMYEDRQFGVKLGFFNKYEGEKRKVGIQSAKIVSQPHGTLFNLILDNEGKLYNKDIIKNGVAIFDIGHKTNDGVVFNNKLEPIGKLSINSKNGMHVAFDDIAEKINNDFKADIKPYEIPSLIDSPTIGNQDVSDILNTAFYNLAVNIIKEVNNHWADHKWEIGQIVFTGGGAELLKPYIQQVYEDTIFPSNCQTSNVEGFLKYAKRTWGEKS